VQNHGGTIRPSLSSATPHICLGDSLLISATTGFNTYVWGDGQTTASEYAHTAGSYYVVATDNFGCMVHSDTVIVQTDSVSHLQISPVTQNLTTSLIASQSGLSSYIWLFGDGSADTTTTATTSHIYSDSGIYTVRLITHQACGTDTATTPVHTTRLATGLLYMSGEQIQVSIIPNPLHSSTLIQIEKGMASDTYQVRLYDLDGVLVKDLGAITTNQLTLQRGNLATGEYLLQVNNEKNKTTFRIVIE
jgi:hypothetical protein